MATSSRASLFLIFFFAMAVDLPSTVTGAGTCGGCDLALAAYFITPDVNISYIAEIFSISDTQTILPYNPSINNLNYIVSGESVNIPFPCGCIPPSGQLGRVFPYTVIAGDTYTSIAQTHYANLTTPAELSNSNSFPPTNIPIGGTVNVTVRCFCGNGSISADYGLFLTYPLKSADSLSSVASAYNSSPNLLAAYNPGVNFAAGKGTVFIPVKDPNGSFRPLKSSTGGISGGGIAGVVVAVIIALFLGVCLYIFLYRRRKQSHGFLLSSTRADGSLPLGQTLSVDKFSQTTPRSGDESSSSHFHKSVEFTYEEILAATDGFSVQKQIGKGGFGSVYYAELRGEKAAVKKMEMQASQQFLAELKVLTNVHHLNLVRLIGYCVKGSLFLVYEYVENGNLSEHLRGHGRNPLSWAARVQISLDSARGLEYIHEHTVPVYIHRDIKSANILIDKNLRAKVADFGLTKLSEVGGKDVSRSSHVVGTFGYMAPEYITYGELSPKIDVYAFGIVLFEIISAKKAFVENDDLGMVTMFKEALPDPDSGENVDLVALQQLVDPALGGDYPIEQVTKMAMLARMCTDENPERRPTMRSVVVALTGLSLTTEAWDSAAFYRNQAGHSTATAGR